MSDIKSRPSTDSYRKMYDHSFGRWDTTTCNVCAKVRNLQLQQSMSVIHLGPCVCPCHYKGDGIRKEEIHHYCDACRKMLGNE